MLLAKAREKGGASERVWMKSAVVEREAGDVAAERKLLSEGLDAHPKSWKMWMMLGQLEEKEGDVDAARVSYAKGTRRCPDAIPLWCAAAALEASANAPAKARAVLEQGAFTLTPVPARATASARRAPILEDFIIDFSRRARLSARAGPPAGFDPDTPRSTPFNSATDAPLNATPTSPRMHPRPKQRVCATPRTRRCGSPR
jgi:pre-mRNA-processing factor 6